MFVLVFLYLAKVDMEYSMKNSLTKTNKRVLTLMTSITCYFLHIAILGICICGIQQKFQHRPDFVAGIQKNDVKCLMVSILQAGRILCICNGAYVKTSQGWSTLAPEIMISTWAVLSSHWQPDNKTELESSGFFSC